jgi:tetratricopeptide (TPR) repeat protein
MYHALLARSLGTVAQYRKEAIEHFETAIELDPWNLRVYSQFAELCEEMQLPARARGLYSKILEIDPEHAKSLEKLAQFNSGEKGAKSSSVISRMFDKRS